MNASAPVSRTITSDGIAVDLRRYLGSSVLWGTLLGASLERVGTWSFTFRAADGRPLEWHWIAPGTIPFPQAIALATTRARQLGAAEIEVEP